MFEDGGQRRDFIHVHDIARANLAAMHAERAGFTAYNICSGHPHTIADMARALAHVANGSTPITTGQYRLGDARHITADPRKAERDMGFRAQVAFAEGMGEFGTAELRA